jgi:hypothetical protein
VYSGPVPKSPGDYRALERALDARGATLLNSAAASEQVTRIEHWHTLLADVSAKTVVLRDLSDLAAASALGFPLFIKGLVKSAKEQGLAACVVNDDNELCARAHAAWQRQQTLVAREFLRLRQSGRTLMNFPQAREYRVTVLDADALATSFYWSQSDPLGELSDRDREAVTALALAVAARLEARVIAVDVAELEDGGWCVIEVGDAQHTGLAHIPPHLYWTALRDL